MLDEISIQKTALAGFPDSRVKEILKEQSKYPSPWMADLAQASDLHRTSDIEKVVEAADFLLPPRVDVIANAAELLQTSHSDGLVRAASALQADEYRAIQAAVNPGYHFTSSSLRAAMSAAEVASEIYPMSLQVSTPAQDILRAVQAANVSQTSIDPFPSALLQTSPVLADISKAAQMLSTRTALDAELSRSLQAYLEAFPDDEIDLESSPETVDEFELEEGELVEEVAKRESYFRKEGWDLYYVNPVQAGLISTIAVVIFVEHSHRAPTLEEWEAILDTVSRLFTLLSVPKLVEYYSNKLSDE